MCWCVWARPLIAFGANTHARLRYRKWKSDGSNTSIFIVCSRVFPLSMTGRTRHRARRRSRVRIKYRRAKKYYIRMGIRVWWETRRQNRLCVYYIHIWWKGSVIKHLDQSLMFLVWVFDEQTESIRQYKSHSSRCRPLRLILVIATGVGFGVRYEWLFCVCVCVCAEGIMA